MTKTVPERFAEIIELLILAIEAHLLGSYLPNRLAAPLSWRVRSSLEGISSKFAEAFAKFIAAQAARGLEPTPEFRAPPPAPTQSQPARTARRGTTVRQRRRTPTPTPTPCAMPGDQASPVAVPRLAIQAAPAAPARAISGATAPASRPRRPPNRKNGFIPSPSFHGRFVTI